MDGVEVIKDVPAVVVQNTQDLTITLVSVKKRLPPYWEAEYINERIEAETNPAHQMLFRFLWMSGCRITEALSLRRKDIDFTNYTATVRWLKSRKYLTRNIPLHPRLRDILQVYTASLKADDLVFPMTRQRAWQLVQRRFAGNPHRFRHSFAVNWLRQAGQLSTLSQLLGHKDIKVTMIYTQIVPIDQGKELMKIRF